MLYTYSDTKWNLFSERKNKLIKNLKICTGTQVQVRELWKRIGKSMKTLHNQAEIK